MVIGLSCLTAGQSGMRTISSIIEHLYIITIPVVGFRGLRHLKNFHENFQMGTLPYELNKYTLGMFATNTVKEVSAIDKNAKVFAGVVTYRQCGS